MSNNIKIILCAVIVAIVISLLFFIVPITGTFIVSYIFSLIAIFGITLSLCIFGKGNNKVPQGYAYIYTAVLYAIISMVVSIIACVINQIVHYPVFITILVHVAILAFFIIRTVTLNIGNEYINNLDNSSVRKHNEFTKIKKSYWK